MKLKAFDIKKLRYPNSNLTYEQVLRNEIHRFKDILQKYIVAYYNSYSPNVYIRQSHEGNLLESLTVDDMVQISANGKQLICKVLINENAIHTSVVDESYGNAFWLMNYGWEVGEDVSFHDRYRFGYFEGAHFLESAIEEFKNTNKYGLTIKIEEPLMFYGY